MTLTACTATLFLMVNGAIGETDISEVDTLQMPGKVNLYIPVAAARASSSSLCNSDKMSLMRNSCLRSSLLFRLCAAARARALQKASGKLTQVLLLRVLLLVRLEDPAVSQERAT